MPIFKVIYIDYLRGSQEAFAKLLIDGECQYDEFCQELSLKTHITQIKTIEAYMAHLADGNTLPKSKFRHLKRIKTISDAKIYEFKSRDLRVYYFKLEKRGKIIILGGYKANQSSDIKKLRNIINQYFESLK